MSVPFCSLHTLAMAPTRLINTTTLEFEGKFAHLSSRPVRDSDFPEYAIVSHRWGEQEISYQEFLYFTSQKNERNDIVARILGVDVSKEKGQGFSKVKSACGIAKSRGFGWLWIDTCCINKESSAELSEAINSMFEWYSDSKDCLVYLEDVDAANVEYDDQKNEFWSSEW